MRKYLIHICQAEVVFLTFSHVIIFIFFSGSSDTTNIYNAFVWNNLYLFVITMQRLVVGETCGSIL